MSCRELALYVHIPFCRSKCVYCDFASYPGREAVWEPYLTALLDELRAWKERLCEYEAATIFIGGGTPSLLPAEMIERILDGVGSCVKVHPGAEITMEANPGTLSREKLIRCRKAGVNRLSFGAQSMNDALLRRLGRIHTAQDVRMAVEEARAAGFGNLSLDLMYALPGQTMEDWRQTLEQAVALAPEHLSAYSLIVEEGTPLHDRVSRGETEVPDDDMAVEMQRMAIDLLSSAGYGRYEISNFALADYACRHNLVYWRRGEYLGVGCAAHSLMNGERFENPRSLDEYLSGKRRQNVVRLTREDRMEETLMLSTRTCRGMDLEAYRREFGVDFCASRARKLKQLERMGLVRVEQGFLRLTRTGMEVQNAVVVELLDVK